MATQVLRTSGAAAGAGNAPEAPAQGACGSSFESRPGWWAAATAVFAAVGFAIAAPTACSEVDACEVVHSIFPKQYNAMAALGLSMVLLNEVISLISTYRGVREAQALVPDIRSRCLPSLLLTIMFTVLVAQHTIIAFSPTAWYATARLGAAAPGGVGAPPLYTITYIEWLIIVPLLLTAAGHCAIHRPLEELARPIVVTNFYIVLSWLAMLATNPVARWLLVIASFSLYGYASMDMFAWVDAYWRTAPPELPSRRLRPCLSIGLVLLFAVYGVVYIATLTGAMSPFYERMSLLFLDVGSKLTMAATFVVIRSNEYHRTLTSVLKRVSTSNVALVSILRGSFDFMLPCMVDVRGQCLLPERSAADMLRLESELGRSIAGLRIGDLLSEERERENFDLYVQNTLRQAESHEAFGGVTLSTQGEWSNYDKPGQLPPVAQVLNCSMACGEQTKKTRTIQCSIHLSVVPNPSLALGGQVSAWQLMAAVRFDAEHMGTVPEDAPIGSAEHGFKAFDLDEEDEETRDSSDGLRKSHSSSQQGDGVVATLNDIANLGISNILKSVRGDSVSGDDDASAIQSTAPSSALQQLAGIKKEPSTRPPSTFSGDDGKVEAQLTAQLRGSWRGLAAKSLGGYEQTFRFLDDGLHLHVSLLGNTLKGTFKLDCSKNPYHLDLQVLCEDGSVPPPIPYIFSLTKSGALRLCGPAGDELRRPTSFDGPGFCILSRVADGINDILPPSKNKMAMGEGSDDGTDTASISTRSDSIMCGSSVAPSSAYAPLKPRKTWSSSGSAKGGSRPRSPALEPMQEPQPIEHKQQEPNADMKNKYDNSMHLMQVALAAQAGIAAVSLAALGASALRRRSA